MIPLCLALLVSQPADPSAPSEPACRVLAKGNGYVVSAVPVGPGAPGLSTDRGPFRPLTTGGRYALLHTDLATGATKKLVEGGEWSVPGPPMGIDWVTHHTQAITGTAVGADRLYVLVSRSSRSVPQGDPGPFGRHPPRLEQALYVFRLADGSTAQELKLPEPKGALTGLGEDSVGGPFIRLTPTTLTVGGVTYRVGERLTPEPPAAPPAADESRTLATGNGYLVHAARVGPQAPRAADDRGGAGLQIGKNLRLSILHTDTKTGRQRKLVEGGEWVEELPAMAINRSVEHAVAVRAAAADRDRLYVLAVRASVLVEDFGGGGRRQETPPRLILYVFRLADGSPVQEVVLPTPRDPLTVPARDALDPDLISVTPTTVTIGTAVYRTGERLELVESKQPPK